MREVIDRGLERRTNIRSQNASRWNCLQKLERARNPEKNLAEEALLIGRADRVPASK